MSMTVVKVAAKTWFNLGAIFPCVLYCEHDIRIYHGGVAPTSPRAGVPMLTSHRGNHPVLSWESTDDVYVYCDQPTEMTISRP